MDLQDILRLAQSGARGFTTGLLGAPVDIVNMAMGGVGGQKPVMGSEWIGDKLQNMGLLAAHANDLPNEITEFAGGLLNPGGGAAVGKGLLGGAKLAHIVFHGSPHTFDKFDAVKAGTKGGTSFGLGHNFSEDKSHAAAYGDKLYKVDIPDSMGDKLLKWESKSALAAQVPQVSAPFKFGGGASVEKIGGRWTLTTGGGTTFPLTEKEVRRMFGTDGTGEQVYRRLVAALDGDEAAASEWLRARGVPGIVNNTERGVRNYTIFPGAEDELKIVGRE